MIYPIYSYGFPVLKKKAQDIEPNSDVDVKKLSQDMFETMYAAAGVGLAGPQIGLNLRIFVVDAAPMDEEKLKGFKKVFINPEKLDEDGKDWGYEEGCLSIPDIREEITRPERIRLRYLDENWQEHEETFEGMAARVIQHEYDHLEGILFTDRVSGLKKRLLKGKLNAISKGKVKHEYKMKFPLLKK